jgi:Major Facilitator Superfamily/Universal stress protein family
VFNSNPGEGGPAWDQAIAWSGLENATYNFVTMVSALFLVGFAQRMGAKRVHAIALGLAAGALIWLAQIHNQYLALVPMIGLGIFWASAVGVPYLMVASMVPAKRTGVYMGILNMMIVVPMLIETVTFGWIFTHLLDSKGSNAITLAGVLMAIGAIAMLWVNPPEEEDESPIVPLGHHRAITVYDKVVVGSDGTPTSLYAVDRAAEVANAAHARLVVVTAYQEGDASNAASPSEGLHRDIYGVEPAGKALEKSVTGLTRDRVRYVDTRLLRGDPAQALLDLTQVLGYAAYLRRLDSDGLNSVLQGYLIHHGYASIAQAARAAAQADPGFDDAAFDVRFTDALADGRLRAVIVLDFAPSDLVELVGYLQEITSDRLTLDLVVVTAYEIGNHRLLVPQLVEPDRTQVTAQLGGSGKPPTATEVVPGATEFAASIATAPLSSNLNCAGCWSGPEGWSSQDWQRSTPPSARAGGC